MKPTPPSAPEMQKRRDREHQPEAGDPAVLPLGRRDLEVDRVAARPPGEARERVRRPSAGTRRRGSGSGRRRRGSGAAAPRAGPRNSVDEPVHDRGEEDHDAPQRSARRGAGPRAGAGRRPSGASAAGRRRPSSAIGCGAVGRDPRPVARVRVGIAVGEDQQVAGHLRRVADRPGRQVAQAARHPARARGTANQPRNAAVTATPPP